MRAAVVAVIVIGVSVVISLCVLVIGLIIIRRYSQHSIPQAARCSYTVLLLGYLLTPCSRGIVTAAELPILDTAFRKKQHTGACGSSLAFVGLRHVI